MNYYKISLRVAIRRLSQDFSLFFHKLLEMTRFIVSDHHFKHENIIEMTNRPFSSVYKMDQEMIDLWNSTVDQSDTVIYVGDLVFGDAESAEEYLSRLNGQILLIAGNHDDRINPDTFPVNVIESAVFQEGGIRYWCTHRPDEVPDDWNDWVIHGHVHNDYPFIDYQNNRINVSVEVVDYTPVPLTNISKCIMSMSGVQFRNIHESLISDHEWYQNNELGRSD